MLAMYKAKRAADMQEAQNSLDLLKTTNEQKRAEEAKNLAEGLIDGQTYYQRLQDLQQQETATALAMIAKKRQAQQKDYQESLSEVEADTKLSDEAKSIATQKLAAENRKALSKLDTEAAQAKLEGETKVTNELKRQFEATKQIKEKTEDLTFGTAWGPIQEQEAAIQKLVVDWARTKAEALKAAGGATPEYEAYVSAGEAKLETDIFKARYGDQISGAASAIANGLSSVVDALMSGGKDLKSAANSMFKDLFKEALKPGLDQLKQLLMDGFKDLFGSVGSGLGSALLGVIGVVGMMLTKSTTSSYTASSVSSGVTTHEVVRGVIAGETTVDIAKVSTALEEVMAPHLSVLRSIEKNTSGGKGSSGSGGGLDVNLVVQGLGTSLKAYLDSYFQDYLLQGAGH
jgi:hypothetical protein